MKISGWGRYPVVDCEVTVPRDEAELVAGIQNAGSVIARGNGRSYGDAAMNRNRTLDMRRFNRFLAFSESTGILTAEAGVMLADILAAFVPRGWFPPVTPGTKFVTLGGMIAADVHGKNHHRDGSIGRFIDGIRIVSGDGTLHTCGPSNNPDLFNATIGGMGLTGVIVSATLRMRKIETASIVETVARFDHLIGLLDAIDASDHQRYSVAWIDCAATGPSLGRGVLFTGDHAVLSDLPLKDREHPLTIRPRRKLAVPLQNPLNVFQSAVIRAFNGLYHARNAPCRRVVDYDRFFYPLDAILNWNRIYGPRGFVQFQCVVPREGGRVALRRIVEDIAQTGTGSPLAVLKLLGASAGHLSFPMPGYTLALDFPVHAQSLALQKRLHAIVQDCGGRLYFAKDATATPQVAQSGYDLTRFNDIRKKSGNETRFASLLSQRIGLSP